MRRHRLVNRTANTARFFEACADGDVETLGALLAKDPTLVRAADPAAPHGGWTGLHTASQHGHVEVVRLLLQLGADPNAREEGDNTYALHWAAASRRIDIVRALLESGSDVHGIGDDHALDAIGWATFFHDPGGAAGDQPEVANLLVKHGARHHIFSAMCLGDLDLVRTVVEENPKALDRRMSRFEQGMTPLHFAVARKRYDLLNLLIELGADLEARDNNGHTALEAALLRGDREAMTRLTAAGAKVPARIRRPRKLSRFADSIRKCVPMISVPDVAAALDWYTSIGFQEIARYPDRGAANFGMVSFGKAEIMFTPNGKRGEQGVSVWLYTDNVDELYQCLKARQFEAATAGATNGLNGIDFVEHLNDTFYGAREFGIRDPNGYVLYFIQEGRRRHRHRSEPMVE